MITVRLFFSTTFRKEHIINKEIYQTRNQKASFFTQFHESLAEERYNLLSILLIFAILILISSVREPVPFFHRLPLKKVCRPRFPIFFYRLWLSLKRLSSLETLLRGFYRLRLPLNRLTGSGFTSSSSPAS